MIRDYDNGMEFLEDNRELLAQNGYLSTFFYLDAPCLLRTDARNFGFCVTGDGERLAVLQVQPFGLLTLGCLSLAAEAAMHIKEKGYLADRMQGNEELCAGLAEALGGNFRELLAMDFMESLEKGEPSDPAVETARQEDLPEIVECLCCFMVDCGLPDPVEPEKELPEIGRFRVLREDGRIVSMAKICPGTDKDRRLSYVYTRPDCRGRGLARRVVNACRNEILDSGYAATLNVDRKNPVSNHLYASLGFRRLFSHGLFVREETE